MTRRRHLLAPLLAMAAALTWAPLRVSAAPNELSAPAVSPSSGTTIVWFGFSVRYVSTAGNAATGVSVAVAGLTLPMSLVSGTAVNGAWARTSLLPAGTWSTTFSATVAKGPAPRISGPTVSVFAATPAPTYTATSSPPVSSVTPVTEPIGSPAASAYPVPGGTSPLPSRIAIPTASAVPGAVTGRSPAPATRASGPTGPTAKPPGTVASPRPSVATGGSRPGASPTATPQAAERPSAPAAMTSSTVLVVAALAAIALLIAFLLLFGRRGDEAEEPVPAPATATPTPPAGPDAEALLAARSVRRARMRSADDPILTAMGIGDSTPPNDRPRSGGRVIQRRVASGPVERPEPGRPRPDEDRD